MSVVAGYVSFHLTSEAWVYDEMILQGEWNDPTSQYVAAREREVLRYIARGTRTRRSRGSSTSA